ncbi:hypothetical protein X970_08160 [Pseudomonas monteilii SB3101]|uniref:Uncharacterized protein n=1 Tax=Pseudomonas monteilii SB3101 TaxID=1435058 RepID=V9V802_9PSED|nr:hypothetical protein X969_08500 [Pseudomonas monteilii SB3078]AHC91046.1 hypothetical protein X970_08160 [Pseudomonas monteilii SB3101]
MATPQFIWVTAFRQENIAFKKQAFLSIPFGDSNLLHIAFASMRGVVPLNTQEIELVNQRLAYTVDKDRILNQLVKGGLRHTGQCFMLIDSLGHLFGKATKSRERTARVDVKYGLRQASEICQQLVARPEEFEID